MSYSCSGLLLSKQVRETIDKNLDYSLYPQNSINIAMPLYNEEKNINRLISLFKKFSKTSKVPFNLILVILSNNGDKTIEIAEELKNDSSNIVIFDEQVISTTSTIGQARAIGFYIGLKIKNDPDNTFLVSCDGDIESAAGEYIDKIYSSFQLNDNLQLVGFDNKIPSNGLSYSRVFPFKVFEDEFFKLMFRELSIVNGRSYAIRGSKYIESGGIDPALRLEDKEFGRRLDKYICFGEKEYINTYVVNSERRLTAFANGIDMNMSYEQKFLHFRNKQKIINNNPETKYPYLLNISQYAFGLLRNVYKSHKRNDYSIFRIKVLIDEYIKNVNSRLSTGPYFFWKNKEDLVNFYNNVWNSTEEDIEYENGVIEILQR